MKRLADLGFIDVKSGPLGELSYAIFFNPYHVIKRAYLNKQVQEDKYRALIIRANQIGAFDLDDIDDDGSSSRLWKMTRMKKPQRQSLPKGVAVLAGARLAPKLFALSVTTCQRSRPAVTPTMAIQNTRPLFTAWRKGRLSFFGHPLPRQIPRAGEQFVKRRPLSAHYQIAPGNSFWTLPPHPIPC